MKGFLDLVAPPGALESAAGELPLPFHEAGNDHVDECHDVKRGEDVRLYRKLRSEPRECGR